MDISSDSEDDCYGNVAKRLQNLKRKYQDDNIESSNLLDDSIDTHSKKNSVNKDCIKTTPENTICGISDDELLVDIELEKLLAVNAKSRVTRSSIRKSNTDSSIIETSPNISNSISGSKNSNSKNSKRGRRGGRTTNNSTMLREVEIIPAPRGRARGRLRRNIPRHVTSNNIQTISIGNTMDYPDNSETQTLFSRNVDNDVVLIEDNDLLDENEELSLKVYWQSSEIFKFSIRKYQKLKSIFKHFTEKENVSENQLLFTYNDTILKPDDTPDSINYNIAKFIDGGIINRPVTILISDHKNECGGIKLKFQCQNVKKPYKTSIQVNDKLALAMMKCAEHFEVPLTKLKFEFDGDSISGSMTPKDLELEGGECIDVKILN